MEKAMISMHLLQLLAAIEDNGGLKETNHPRLKLICDKQTFDVINIQCMGLLNPISETKAVGMDWSIEIGDMS